MSPLTTTAHAGPHFAGRPLIRAAAGLAGLAALGGSIALIGPWALALWLLPDVAILAGWSREAAAEGRLAPRAVPLYNALHALAGPLALTAVGLFTGQTELGLGVLWLSHVLIDRSLGYGLRTPEGRQRG